MEASTGMESGSTILSKIFISEQPSMRAASSSSSGIERKKVRMMIMLYTLSISGTMSAQIVSTML